MRLSAFRSALLLACLMPAAGCTMSEKDMGLDQKGTGMTRLGDKMREKGDAAAAMDFYRRALRTDPKNVAAITGLASAQEQWGDRDAAAQTLKQGVAAVPDDGALRRAYGKMLLTLDQPAAAKVQYEAALDEDDDDAKAMTGLGVALDQLGEHKKAQAQYKKALKEEPKNLATKNNLAYSYILSRRYDLAIKTLEPQASHPAASSALLQNLALAYGMAGMEADAERTLRASGLAPEKVLENMEYYRRQRAENAVDTAPYAEVGTYATEGMAVAQAQKLRAQYDKEGKRLKPIVLPQVASPGGTPRFAVRMMGCAKPDDVARLCDTLKATGLPCVPKGKGVE